MTERFGPQIELVQKRFNLRAVVGDVLEVWRRFDFRAVAAQRMTRVVVGKVNEGNEVWLFLGHRSIAAELADCRHGDAAENEFGFSSLELFSSAKSYVSSRSIDFDVLNSVESPRLGNIIGSRDFCRRLKDDNVICVRGSIVRRAMLAIGWLNSMSGIAQRFWELNPLSVVYVARLADHERDWIRQRFLRNRMSYNWIGIVVLAANNWHSPCCVGPTSMSWPQAARDIDPERGVDDGRQ